MDRAGWLASDREAANYTGEYFCKRKLKLKMASKASKDMASAQRLFALSEKVTGVKGPSIN